MITGFSVNLTGSTANLKSGVLQCLHTSHQMRRTVFFHSFLALHVCNAPHRSHVSSSSLALPRAGVLGDVFAQALAPRCSGPVPAPLTSGGNRGGFCTRDALPSRLSRTRPAGLAARCVAGSDPGAVPAVCVCTLSFNTYYHPSSWQIRAKARDVVLTQTSL